MFNYVISLLCSCWVSAMACYCSIIRTLCSPAENVLLFGRSFLTMDVCFLLWSSELVMFVGISWHFLVLPLCLEYSAYLLLSHKHSNPRWLVLYNISQQFNVIIFVKIYLLVHIFFETGFWCVAQAGLDSWSSCFCSLSAEIMDMHHHIWLFAIKTDFDLSRFIKLRNSVHG
jgi:hypothetical protein